MHFWNNCFLKEIWMFKTIRNTWERTWELGSIINIPGYLLWIKSSQYKFWGTSVRRTKGGKFPWLKCYLLLFSSVQSLSCVQLFATPWTAVRQASLSITNSQSLPKPMSIESVMPSNHLIFCRPLFLLPSIFPSIRVFSNESALRIRWPKYWSFSFNFL